MLYAVVPDVREFEKWMTDLETRTLRSVAASSITTLVRMARTRSIKLIKGRLGVPTRDVSKRIRAWRAHPKTLNGGLMVNQRDIPEINLGARQTGHPGARRKSTTKAARRERKRRKARGAKPSRAGGVKGRSRAFPGAWIGHPGPNERGAVQVLERRRGKARVIKRSWKPALRTIGDQTAAATRAWPSVFNKRLKTALERRGQSKAATFLADQGKI